MRAQPRLGRTATTLALYGGLAAVGIAWGALRGDANVYRIAGRWTPLGLFVLSPAIGLGLGLAVVFGCRLAVHRFEWSRKLHREFRGLLGRLTEGEALVLALSSGIGEEVFFRGALLPVAGLWLQAAVFALLHVAPADAGRARQFLPWTAMAFVMGLAFGALALLLGDLGGPMVAHVTINYLNLRFIIRNELL